MLRPDETTQELASAQDFRGAVVSQRGPERRSDGWIAAPDASVQDPGSLTYEPGLWLREKPFSLSPDPRFFFGSSTHCATFDALVTGIRRREGILALTGEVGTGKTTLCRAVLQSLDRKTFAAFVPDPFLSREDLLKTLLVEFGVVSVDDIRNGRLRHTSRTDLSYTLYEFLTSLQPLQAFAVVILDEAQNLETRLLEEIRILSDLENGQKLIQLVLVGQPELQLRLGRPEMRQLTQRLSIRCELPPLAMKDVGPYVSHRLGVAGNNVTLQFTDAAIGLIYAASSGIPRVINLVCDRALGRVARTGKMSVDTEHVLGAVDDLGLNVPRNLRAVPSYRPGPNLKPGDSASPAASAAVEERQPQPQPQGRDSLPVADPTVHRTSGLTGATRESPLPDGRVLDWDEPWPNLESPDSKPRGASAGRKDRQPQPEPQDEGLLPIVDPTLDEAGDQSSETERSPYFNRNGLDWDRPGPDLESLDAEWGEASERREKRQPHLEGKSSLPAADPIAGKPGGPTRPTERALPIRRTTLRSEVGDTRVRNLQETPTAVVAFEQDIAATQPRRRGLLARGWRAFGITLLVLTTAIVGYRYWMSTQSPQPQEVVTLPGEPLVPPEPPLPAAPADVLSTTGGGEPASQNLAPGPTEAGNFAVRMATFQSAGGATIAVQELQDAGYRAYSTNVTLRDGRPAVAVFLGPYTELAQVKPDFERARQIPGYDSARIVLVGPTDLPAKP